MYKLTVFLRRFIPVAAALAACTPKLVGTCTASSDCQPGETCSADHICLRDASGNGNGDAGDGSDAGDAGNATASIDVVAPAAGAVVRGTFHVSARVSSAVAVHDVTFTATDSQSSAALGSATVSSGAGDTWAGDLTLDQTTFGGSADVRAVLHRTGLADLTAAKVTVTVDQNAPSIQASWDATRWYALDAGLTLTASVSDDRSGISSAHLILPDGGSTSATISNGTATFQLAAADVGAPGAAAVVPVSLQAADLAGNQTLLASASSIRVDDEPPALSVEALDPAVWRTGSLDFTATLDDGAGAGVASASLLAGDTWVSGQPDAGGVFTFHADLSSLPDNQGALGFQVVARDVVGNESDAGFTLNVDNLGPLVSAETIDTAFDGTDSSPQGWFQGPTVAPAAGPIAISAVIADPNLVTTGPNAPAAVVVGGSRYPGTLASGRWTFQIPRQTTDVVVTFDAQDLAGNHPDSAPSIPLYFDDVKFTAAVATDATWYGRSASVSPTVAVTLSGAPRSGMASIALKVAGKSDVTCSGGGTSYSCALPSTYATAGTEAALGFSVAATANSAYGTTASGSRNIDDVAPVVSNAAAIPYPGAQAAPLSWGHDGGHFTLGDRATSGGNTPQPYLYVFSAYDCGAGVNTGASSVSFSPNLPSKSVTPNPAGTHSCANGVTATVYNFVATADFTVKTAGQFTAVNNTLTLTATATDAASGQPHTSSPVTKDIAVTRWFWIDTAPPNLSFLALGPRLFASGAGALYAIDRNSGAITTWATSGAFLVGVAPNAGTPAVVYSDGTRNLSAGNATSGTSSFGFCASSGADVFGPVAMAGTSSSVVASAAVTGATGCKCTSCSTLGDPCNTLQCWLDGGQSCVPVYSNFTNTMTLSGSSVSCSVGGATPGTTCNGSPSAPGGLGYAVSSTSGLYVGANATPSWVVTNSGGGVLGTYPGGIASGHGWPLIDGSGAVAFLPDVAGGGIDAVPISGSGFGARLYNIALPFAGPVSDMALASNGILYMVGGGYLYAIYTDSTGAESAQAGAWPARCHDPCASSLAGFSCPY